MNSVNSEWLDKQADELLKEEHLTVWGRPEAEVDPNQEKFEDAFLKVPLPVDVDTEEEAEED